MNVAHTQAEADTEEKGLLHSLELEHAIIGAILYDNAALEMIPDWLGPADFYEPFHQRLYTEIAVRVQKGQLADPRLLVERFKSDPAFQELGAERYLADLVDRAPPASNVPDYSWGIHDLALRRRLKQIGEEITKCAEVDTERDAKEQVEAAEANLYDLAERGATSQGPQDFATTLAGSLEIITAAMERDGGLSGISTGLIDLDRKLGGLHGSDLLVLAGRPSMGKAQALDAKVLMRDGSWKLMGDLRLGDELASVDGAPSRVAGIFPQGRRPVYRLTTSDGRSTRACGEHLWAVESCKIPGRKAVLSTDQLREMLATERYQKRVCLPLPSGHFGHDYCTVDPWLLGVLIGNGCMVSGHLAVSTADAATLCRVQKVVGHDCVTPTGDSGYDYRISRSAELGLARALDDLGLMGKGSAEKFIPDTYLKATRQTRLELLRGLLDTDGWVETFGVVRYATASRQLADDVQALVRSLGGICTISSRIPTYSYKGEKRNGKTSYVCNIRHPDRASLLTLTRKRRRCENELRWRNPTITSIEPDGEDEVQCIRVTHPSSLYITDDYVVTHNTALATNIAFNVAKAYAWEDVDGVRKTVRGGQVLFFSLEMSAEQLGMRLLADVSGVSSDRLRKGQIDAADYAKIRDAAIEIQNAPLSIDATGALSIDKLAARARRHKRRHGLDLIVVDYLQLATSPGRRGEGRVQEVTDITTGLKALAKELSVPVLALSQLSRQVEQRDDKRPQLSDLRESGSIEQDADAVMFVYREAYYLGRAEPKPDTPEHLTWQEELDRCARLAEVIIGKQRHGPIGTVKLSFDEETTRFGNLARESLYEEDGSRRPYRDD